METLHFDKNALGWTRDEYTNHYYLRSQINYLQEKLAYRGYLYLNEIYETFGIAWNPDRVNVCYRANDGVNIEFYPTGENEYVIKVYQ